MAGTLKHQLPTGTYFVTNTSAVLHVALSAAVDAAEQTGKSVAVIVHGLEHGLMGWAGGE